MGDHGDMAIGDSRRGQLTRRPLLDLIPMLMLMLIMATGGVIEDGDGEDTTDHGDMATGDAKRGQLTRPPSPDLMLTLLLMPMLGMVITDMPGHGDGVDIIDHGDMDTGEGSKR